MLARNTVLAALVLVLGCASTYVPDPDTYDIESITEFRSDRTVALVNGASDAEIFLSSNGPERWFGNPRDYTNTAIQITERELEKRGMHIAKDSERTLHLTMAGLHGETSAGGFAFDIEVELHVTAGDGTQRSYQARNRSTYFARAVDGAVMRAVTALLGDPEIVAYLTR